MGRWVDVNRQLLSLGDSVPTEYIDDVTVVILNNSKDPIGEKLVKPLVNLAIKLVENGSNIGFPKNYLNSLLGCETDWIWVLGDDDFYNFHTILNNFFAIINSCPDIGYIFINHHHIQLWNDSAKVDIGLPRFKSPFEYLDSLEFLECFANLGPILFIAASVFRLDLVDMAAVERAADQYVRDWARVYGLKTVVFRHSSIYGGRQFATFDQGWIGWFCQQALKQKLCRMQDSPIQPFTIAGTGKQVRDVLHSDDLVRLYRQAYEKRQIMKGEIFNIGGGPKNSLSLIELFSLLSDLLRMSCLRYEKIERRASDQDCFVASISKANRLLAWSPQVSCKTGISCMLSCCQSME